MTHVECSYGGNKYSVIAEGHASGSPEVCAAVSAMLQSLALYVEKYAVSINTEIIREGYVRLEFTGAGDGFELVLLGLEAMAKQYPAFLSVGRIENSI